ARWCSCLLTGRPDVGSFAPSPTSRQSCLSLSFHRCSSGTCATDGYLSPFRGPIVGKAVITSLSMCCLVRFCFSSRQRHPSPLCGSFYRSGLKARAPLKPITSGGDISGLGHIPWCLFLFL